MNLWIQKAMKDISIIYRMKEIFAQCLIFANAFSAFMYIPADPERV
jgi:hypothetical protein